MVNKNPVALAKNENTAFVKDLTRKGLRHVNRKKRQPY